jgi:hypothetical protein
LSTPGDASRLSGGGGRRDVGGGGAVGGAGLAATAVKLSAMRSGDFAESVGAFSAVGMAERRLRPRKGFISDLTARHSASSSSLGPRSAIAAATVI